jgi:hypothetical protein
LAQSTDGSIHVVYSVLREAIQYVRIHESWIAHGPTSVGAFRGDHHVEPEEPEVTGSNPGDGGGGDGGDGVDGGFVAKLITSPGGGEAWHHDDGSGAYNAADGGGGAR